MTVEAPSMKPVATVARNWKRQTSSTMTMPNPVKIRLRMLRKRGPARPSDITGTSVGAGRTLRSEAGCRSRLSTATAQVLLELLRDLVAGQRLHAVVAGTFLQLAHVLGELGVLLGGLAQPRLPLGRLLGEVGGGDRQVEDLL